MMKAVLIMLEKLWMCLAWLLLWSLQLAAQPKTKINDVIQHSFQHPGQQAKPWVFWYWMHAAVSKEGITADLEAMKSVGIAGAYLMPIKDTSANIPFSPTARQLSAEWWQLIKFAMQEAKRLNLQLGVHVSDGFALAGGPWITPELSMQKLVWSNTVVQQGATNIQLSQPASYKGFYKEVAILAYPLKAVPDEMLLQPIVSTSNAIDASFLSEPNNQQTFRSDTACWIQYSYDTSVTIRSLEIKTGGNTYQALRLKMQSSNDGITFTDIAQLQAPRHGWQDADENFTYAIPATTATHFRFVYNKDGSLPGAEDLDAAKWKPSLKVKGIYLSNQPKIHQYESKNGSVWRMAQATYDGAVTVSDVVPQERIINLTGKLDKQGRLQWKVPAGNWMIVRIGHTSQGHTNYTGGAGLGLECDKFNPAAVQLQLNSWFGQFYSKTDAVLAKQVLKVLHVDSWEAGSQNWSVNFAAAFQQRRGYDITPWLLCMTGVPVNSAEKSEKVLHDVRQTIADLVSDVFYTQVKAAAKAKGCLLSAEAIAPTMMSDGLTHFKYADLPMGEFWHNSPTHDKPNDMRDAISAAHMYGKNIVQAESFTTVRMDWTEHPGKLKALGDRQFALGINKLVFHVFAHNPWVNKQPGMTLDGVGLYFQRDQTWFQQSKAWMEYLSRCQALLQLGKPVTDIAVFTSDALPRRALLPDRLVNVLPGLMTAEKLQAEQQRLANIGQPLRSIPDGVSHSANMADPENWTDPLNGYAYDSFNPDVLMQMTVAGNKVVTPGGNSYSVLVFPAQHALNPNHLWMTVPVAKKILSLLQQGARIVLEQSPVIGRGMKDENAELRKVFSAIEAGGYKGQLHIGAWTKNEPLMQVQKDVDVTKGKGQLAWTHRRLPDADIYFVSNQSDRSIRSSFTLRSGYPAVEALDPVTGKYFNDYRYTVSKEGIAVDVMLDAAQAVFFICKKEASPAADVFATIKAPETFDISRDWALQFDTAKAGPAAPLPMAALQSWTTVANDAVRYYSGTVKYSKTVNLQPQASFQQAWLEMESVYNIATVKVNGVDCGTIWTPPYQLDISAVLKEGTNLIEIEVTNTWHNRLIADAQLPPHQRLTFTTAPFRLQGKPLQPAGLTGAVKLVVQ